MIMLPLKQCLPGVTRIGWLDCEKLQPNLRERAKAGLQVAALTSVYALPICGDASCEAVTEKTNGANVETTTLKFKTTEYLDADVQLGFVVTDAEGYCWLVGAAEKPFPHVKMTRKRGTTGGESAVWEVEVKAVGERSLIPCIY